MRWIIFLLVSPVAFGANFEYANDDYGRIVGGQNADITSFNYQISLRFFGSHRCGGSLVKRNVVVTAAHCVFGFINNVNNFQVYAGSSLLSSGGQFRAVKSIHINPQYNQTTLDYDSAIIILTSNYNLGKDIGTVGLVQRGSAIATGREGIVTGWGYTEEGGPDVSDHLQYVEIPKVDWNACSKAYGSYGLTRRMACWGYMSGGKDACQGDSGGPLVIYNSKGTPQLAGIVSWGIGCARNNYPGIYADISNVQIRDFLTQFL